NEACTVSMNKDQFITANFGVKLPTIIPNPPVVSVEPEIITPEVTIYNSDIEFVGLKESYNVGELLVLDLVEHLQVVPHFERVDLWVAIIAPTGDFYYMTNQPLQPFSSKPHPYRLNIISSQLMLNETRYHLLYFDVPVTANGTYKFYAVYNQAGADIDNLIFTQQSTLAYATTILQNNINPSIISTIPNILTMLVGEKLELMVDSNSSFNALLSACKISSTNIVQSQSGISSSGSGISCYLTALMAGEAILTTINKNGNSIETQIIVP
ncbi:MAG: hypothetical protein KAH84_00975, partial [Thiomargarita sp.]|nr:hypothetical protein [Thiomargarita sp.]